MAGMLSTFHETSDRHASAIGLLGVYSWVQHVLWNGLLGVWTVLLLGGWVDLVSFWHVGG